VEYDYKNDITLGISDSIGYLEMKTDVTGVVIEHRYEISNGLLPKIELPYMMVTLRGNTFDPLQNARVKQGAQIAMTVIPESPISQFPLFIGWIDEISVNYEAFGQPEITITAYNVIKQLMSPKVDYLALAQQGCYSRLQTLFTQARLTYTGLPAMYSTGAVGVMPAETVADTTIGDLVQQTLDAEAGMIRAEYGMSTYQVKFFNRNEVAYTVGSSPANNWVGFSTNHNISATHFCLNNAEITFDTNTQVNWIRAELSWDSTTYIDGTTYAACKNATSVAAYGAVTETVALNLTRPTGTPTQYLKTWVDALVLSRTPKRVKSITATPIRPSGNLNGYLLQKSIIDVADVTIQRGSNSISAKYLITGVRHELTPTSWSINYELFPGI
jgi:hypothetical protein